MAELTVQTTRASGITPTFVPVTASDTFQNAGDTVIHVKNGGGASINATVVATAPCSQSQLHNEVVAVPAGQERVIGPFPRDRFGSLVTVNFSGIGSVTAAVYRV